MYTKVTALFTGSLDASHHYMAMQFLDELNMAGIRFNVFSLGCIVRDRGKTIERIKEHVK